MFTYRIDFLKCTHVVSMVFMRFELAMTEHMKLRILINGNVKFNENFDFTKNMIKFTDNLRLHSVPFMKT